MQDTGIRLHAASGNVSVQAQSAALNLTAKHAVDLQSTQASVHISAPQRIVLNGAGSYLLIDGGNIELGTRGPAQFKAAANELAGGGSVTSQSPLFPRPSDWHGPEGDQYFQLRSHTGQAVAQRRYRAQTGNHLIEGFTDAQGRTSMLAGHVDQHARFELVNEVFDQHFILKDSKGTPFVGLPYRIRSQNGTLLEGVTDSHGRTALFAGDVPEQIELLYRKTDFSDDQGTG